MINANRSRGNYRMTTGNDDAQATDPWDAAPRKLPFCTDSQNLARAQIVLVGS